MEEAMCLCDQYTAITPITMYNMSCGAEAGVNNRSVGTTTTIHGYKI